MFLRFVIHSIDEDSGRRQGLFQALAELRDQGALQPHEKVEYERLYEWFCHNLNAPEIFSRSRRRHAKNVALSWFKPTARGHISNMRALAAILDAHGITVDVIREQRPGYIVYEDEHQVVAEPFQETTT